MKLSIQGELQGIKKVGETELVTEIWVPAEEKKDEGLVYTFVIPKEKAGRLILGTPVSITLEGGEKPKEGGEQ